MYLAAHKVVALIAIAGVAVLACAIFAARHAAVVAACAL
jgi:hypothetical protein